MFNLRKEWKIVTLMVLGFAALFYFPVEQLQKSERLANAMWESLYLVRWYAREHVLLCLVPAFFIAGAIGVFISSSAVMKYLGPAAKRIVAYGVASVSGSVLAVCSCTVLPLFAGIYRSGAGLGPATAFLYSGPAINVLAIILTARILGAELGAARAIGAVLFSIVVGLLMQLIFRKEEVERAKMQTMPTEEPTRPLWQNALYFATLAGILVFANWGKPAADAEAGLWTFIYSAKWYVTGALALLLCFILTAWFNLSKKYIALVAVPTIAVAALLPAHPEAAFATGAVLLSVGLVKNGGETGEWFESSWGFAKQILPLLLAGVVVAGALLGRPGHEGLIPSDWVAKLVGGNSIGSNFFASIAGAFMYFATLTEVPIVQGLMGSGMGKGPALALLLSGPALSLPNMLVIRSVLGTKKTVVYVALVVMMATISGILYGTIFS